MSKADEAVLVGYLAEASREPVGGGKSHEYLTEAAAHFVRQKLYSIRRANREYAHISFTVRGSVLWLINTGHADPFPAEG